MGIRLSIDRLNRSKNSIFRSAIGRGGGGLAKKPFVNGSAKNTALGFSGSRTLAGGRNGITPQS
jgi:hypothetical protein